MKDLLSGHFVCTVCSEAGQNQQAENGTVSPPIILDAVTLTVDVCTEKG